MRSAGASTFRARLRPRVPTHPRPRGEPQRPHPARVSPQTESFLVWATLIVASLTLLVNALGFFATLFPTQLGRGVLRAGRSPWISFWFGLALVIAATALRAHSTLVWWQGAVIAVGLGSMALALRGARAAPPAAEAGAGTGGAAFRTVQLRVPYVPEGNPRPRRTGEIGCEVLRDDLLQVSWDAFDRGARTLRRQLDAGEWRPDLVVAVNPGGAAIASVIFSKSEYPMGLAYVRGDRGHRALSFLSLPHIAKPPAGCEVLLVDIQTKSGNTLAVARDSLAARGFAAERMRVATLTLGDLKRVPEGTGPHALTPAAFPQSQDTQPEGYGEWLSRLHFIAYLSRHAQRPPWDR
jgi:hypoxanthine phosphoribosyltransferase